MKISSYAKTNPLKNTETLPAGRRRHRGVAGRPCREKLLKTNFYKQNILIVIVTAQWEHTDIYIKPSTRG